MNSNSNFSFKQYWVTLFSIALFGMVLLFQGCKAVGPDYTTPIDPVPNAWDLKIQSKLVKEPKSDLENWWTLFNDPILNALIEKAKSQNRNLKIAYSRVIEARTEMSGVSGAKLPSLETSASVGVEKQSDLGSLKPLAPANGFKPQGIFQQGFSSSWEIDVFGRVRRSMEAANYAYETSIQDYYDVMTVLLADVAINYLDLRSKQQQRVNTEKNVIAQEESLTLTEVMFNSGISSYLDVVQAKSNLLETKSQIPDYKLGEYKAINKLSQLLGTTYDSLGIDLYEIGKIPMGNTNFNVGLPTDLLRQRPDIRAAELNIAMNNAKIGVSTADLYPTFSLGGFFGFDSQDAGNLFSVPGMNWGLSLPISWQIFNRKQIKANIAINEQQTQQALLNYENTVLKAYIEVEDLLVSLHMNQEKYKFISEAVGQTEEAVGLVKIQYDTQITDFQNVLDTQRSLFRQQNQKVTSETDIVINLIKLYKALGGGWTIQEEVITINTNKE
ncbi:TolC family protein [Formosa sp. PL04]|uniref:TolC family protein n=1 Tax=Formosa sp. PL04 TaxID=3081755 RepID=UPI002980F4AA|nr:TolC family protein [Formosa sp. PL04]MDW5287378.1 TolC family protein [Formosa sp. PL04]